MLQFLFNLLPAGSVFVEVLPAGIASTKTLLTAKELVPLYMQPQVLVTEPLDKAVDGLENTL